MKKLLILIILLGIISAGVYFWWQNGLIAVNTADKTTKTFVISKGDGVRKIADNLKESGLIRDPIVFFLLIKQKGIESRLQAGVFYLSPSMSAEQILKEFGTGKFDIAITIPEGKRAEEIADILEENFDQFNDEWRTKLNAEEGYLFPDTYYFPRETGIEQIISTLKNNFDNKYSQVTNNTDLSKEEIVILASLIEREAKFAQDREMISSVIHNRLDIGMKLDIDATVQYAVGYYEPEKRWWKKGLTYDDLEIDSPYNTYTNPGLPPKPISNPGLASLQAAGSPAESDFIFYISDKTGTNHYAETLDEHNRNVEKYLR